MPLYRVDLAAMTSKYIGETEKNLAQLLARHHRPTPRLATGAALAREKLATAMIDVSDGLLQDLGHICKASGISASSVPPTASPAARTRRGRMRLPPAKRL